MRHTHSSTGENSPNLVTLSPRETRHTCATHIGGSHGVKGLRRDAVVVEEVLRRHGEEASSHDVQAEGSRIEQDLLQIFFLLTGISGSYILS
jgi:hypothetical protein